MLGPLHPMVIELQFSNRTSQVGTACLSIINSDLGNSCYGSTRVRSSRRTKLSESPHCSVLRNRDLLHHCTSTNLSGTNNSTTFASSTVSFWRLPSTTCAFPLRLRSRFRLFRRCNLDLDRPSQRNAPRYMVESLRFGSLDFCGLYDLSINFDDKLLVAEQAASTQEMDSQEEDSG